MLKVKKIDYYNEKYFNKIKLKNYLKIIYIYVD